VSYAVHRVRLLYEKAADRNAAFAAIQAFLQTQPDSPEHLDARRLATDLLDLPPETQAGLAPRTRSTAGSVISPRLLEAGLRLERTALAGVAAHPELARFLEELGPEHFSDALHRRARAHLLGVEQSDAELTPLLAELYALSDLEEISEPAAKQLLLRLRERRLQEELRAAPAEQRKPLAEAVAAIREEIERLATMPAANPR
jgi:hypothetical protein